VSATASLSFPSRDGYIPLGGVVCVDVRGGDGVVYRRGGRLFVALSLSLGECCLSGEQGSSKIIFDENSCMHCVEFGMGCDALTWRERIPSMPLNCSWAISILLFIEYFCHQAGVVACDIGCLTSPHTKLRWQDVWLFNVDLCRVEEFSGRTAARSREGGGDLSMEE